MIVLNVIGTAINVAVGLFAGAAISEATEQKWKSAFQKLAIAFGLFFLSALIIVYKLSSPTS